MRTSASHIFPSPSKRNRLNNEGCKFFEGEYNHYFTFNTEEMARIVLSTVRLGECDPKEFDILIDNFTVFVHNAQFYNVSLPSTTTNLTIINSFLARENNVTYNPISFSHKKWEEKDDNFIIESILNRNEEAIYAQYQRTKSPNSIKSRIQFLKKKFRRKTMAI